MSFICIWYVADVSHAPRVLCSAIWANCSGYFFLHMDFCCFGFHIWTCFAQVWVNLLYLCKHIGSPVVSLMEGEVTREFSIWNSLWILLTALIWGCTNPFLRAGAKGIDVVEKDDRERSSRTYSLFGTLKKAFAEVKWCLMNWRLTLPFAVNQSGSILFYYRSVYIVYFWSF